MLPSRIHALVNERGGLKRMACGLGCHLVRGEPTQLVLNERKHFFREGAILRAPLIRIGSGLPHCE